MMNIPKAALIIILTILIAFKDLRAQDLSEKRKGIVAIAALTGKGNLPALKLSLNKGLDAGLSINEIKEMLVQLAAYCGFPRSLNAINTFSAVVTERKARGITDPTGVEPTSTSNAENKYEIGKVNLEKLTGRAENGVKTGYAAFVPVIDTFLKEHLFADIFSRGVLTNQERELTTISALASIGGVESQLRGHLSISMRLGFTEPQLLQMLSIIENCIGRREADAGRKILSKVVASRE
ncbi:MAG TPA: carboxymuconolactone decarboxylase family protein [Mucilaginibacter sp.]|nr:carboxymuconolactone decarboxylase family protein [Mucilaginibacter sp.]